MERSHHFFLRLGKDVVERDEDWTRMEEINFSEINRMDARVVIRCISSLSRRMVKGSALLIGI
jgi:hypothetical protein